MIRQVLARSQCHGQFVVATIEVGLRLGLNDPVIARRDVQELELSVVVGGGLELDIGCDIDKRDPHTRDAFERTRGIIQVGVGVDGSGDPIGLTRFFAENGH